MVVVVVGYFVGAAFLPRWWARQIGGWTHDSFTRGLLYGLAFGIVFTLVPLAIAATAFYRRLNQRVRAVIVLVAILFAIPNLLTLGISLGSGGGAHAGNRILDDRAPFFQGATLIGAIIAVVVFGARAVAGPGPAHPAPREEAGQGPPGRRCRAEPGCLSAG